MSIYRFITSGKRIIADEAFMAAHYAAGTYVLEPEVVQPKQVNWKITRLAFRNRFTQAEKIALYTAAASNVAIKVYLDDVNAATFIDLQRPDTIAGVQALELATIIAGGRAATILTTEPTSEEEYK